MLGTPYYMSPEQFVVPRTVDYRTDLWALGVILGELLIGEPPFNGETLGQLMYNIMSAPMPNLSARRPDLPPAFVAVVQRCMERDPSRRHANVAELARALAPFGTGAQNLLLERMARSLGVHGGPPPAALGSGPAVGPNTVGGMGATPFPGAPYNTAASWGQASASGGAARRSNAVPIALGAGVLVVAALGGGRLPGAARAGPIGRGFGIGIGPALGVGPGLGLGLGVGPGYLGLGLGVGLGVGVGVGVGLGLGVGVGVGPGLGLGPGDRAAPSGHRRLGHGDPARPGDPRAPRRPPGGRALRLARRRSPPGPPISFPTIAASETLTGLSRPEVSCPARSRSSPRPRPSRARASRAPRSPSRTPRSPSSSSSTARSS